ncbi:hypothetical protein ACHAWO_007244 [Cyclotella atomus]|uniref:Uncharacterized protein n=1 Tax=Cyclotella atomus TaxID=382360 RepID=A0ABD3NPN2_9STRA
MLCFAIRGAIGILFVIFVDDNYGGNARKNLQITDGFALSLDSAQSSRQPSKTNQE